MSKFNTANTTAAVNRSGYPAYRMSDKEHLVTAVLTTMFGEPKYYGSTDNDIVRLATACAAADPDFLCRLAVYVRREAGLRSVSHVLAAVIARHAREYTRIALRGVIRRPDDITEIMACYQSMYGKPFPNAMKREIAQIIQTFDAYQLAKYKSAGKSISLRDVLRITHPVPRTPEVEALFKKVLDDSLETPYTWETELSEKGNTREVWDALIASGKVGYMALLRNLRSIIRTGADLAPVLDRLSDADQVRRSRQLPFRFFSAYRMLEAEGLMNPDIHRALEKALTVSIENMDQIPGRTLIAVDVSGSMGQLISARSTVRCCDIAALMGAMASRLCEDATVCYFDADNSWGSFRKGYQIIRHGRFDSILDICRSTAFAGGGTDLSLPMRFALEEDGSRALHPFDRIIYFSDNECNRSYRGLARTVQGLVDQYRSRYNPDFWVHGIDLQGYGSQQFCGARFNLIAGWSDKVLPFINLAEAGVGSLVSAIESYEAW